MPEHVTPDVRTGWAAVRRGAYRDAPSGFGWDSSGNAQIWDSAGNVVQTWTPLQTGAAFLASSSGQRAYIFRRTVTLTSAAAATPVSVVAASEVTAGAKAYITGFIGKVNGATNWATTATVKLQDTNGTAVDFVTFAVAALTGNAVVVPGTANVTLENAYALGSGGTASKGLQVVGDANGTGSNFVLTVFGYYLL